MVFKPIMIGIGVLKVTSLLCSGWVASSSLIGELIVALAGLVSVAVGSVGLGEFALLYCHGIRLWWRLLEV